jgi:hypothetical protein
VDSEIFALFLENPVRFSFSRLALACAPLLALACSACASFDSANPANADPKVAFEQKQAYEEANHVHCYSSALGYSVNGVAFSQACFPKRSLSRAQIATMVRMPDGYSSIQTVTIKEDGSVVIAPAQIAAK